MYLCSRSTREQQRRSVGIDTSRTHLYQSGQKALTGLAAEQGGAALGIEKQVLTFRHILDVNLITTVHLGQNASPSDSLGQLSSNKKEGRLGLLAGAPGGGNRNQGLRTIQESETRDHDPWRRTTKCRGTTHLAGVSSCRQYRKLMRTPCSAILLMAASVICTLSVDARIRTIR